MLNEQSNNPEMDLMSDLLNELEGQMFEDDPYWGNDEDLEDEEEEYGDAFHHWGAKDDDSDLWDDNEDQIDE